MKKSFTLVEILIVVTILGILAAVIMPSVKDYVQQAKESAAKDNLRILRNAIGLYAARNKRSSAGLARNRQRGRPLLRLLVRTGIHVGNFGEYKALPFFFA